MHELSLAASLLESLEQASAQHHFTQVKRLFVEVGELSCVEREALRFALQSIAPNTLLEGAELTITSVAGELLCRHCGAQYAAAQIHTPCPACQQFGARIVAGDDTQLVAVDVDDRKEFT